MTDTEIRCWDDAGSWESAESLTGDSMFNRFTAVWEAIRERYASLGISNPYIDLSEEVKRGESIRVWCSNIMIALDKLIPYFAEVNENNDLTVSIDTPFCGEPIVISPNAESFFQEWTLPAESIARGPRSLQLHIEAYSMILTAEQTGFLTSLEPTPATVSFTPFNTDELLVRYPLNTSLAIADFLWNAYRILKLLYCPVRYVSLSWDRAEKTYATRKGFVLYHHTDGSCSYVLTPDYPPEDGDLIYSETLFSEEKIWNMAEWDRTSGDVSEMKREIVQLSSGSTCIIVDKTTAGALVRNHSFCKTLSGTETGLPLDLIYERQYHDTGDGYFAPPYPEGEWISAVNGVIPYDGTASYMENEISCPAGGTGHTFDWKRHCRLQVEMDLRCATSFRFL